VLAGQNKDYLFLDHFTRPLFLYRCDEALKMLDIGLKTLRTGVCLIDVRKGGSGSKVNFNSG
jgi:hypothetical protein